ncbi:sulfatase [Sphingomonas sp. R-74633]|uniref:sulfatase family protein n=1 Tax=Sphingomonas sp. R-74633 TaxID=2751188 RepID=UPI0015D3E6F9|nr:sulfatase [Sphingomonas sp. R-74633]NYT41467.1 sulfatase [Sphingomonas sp. R-74633]
MARVRGFGRTAELLGATALALGGAAVTTGAAHAQSAPAKGAQRPDIVLFVADDLSREDVGAYGSPDARTPNMDAMAKEGMRFNWAFASSPTCTVSRSSILTGDYPIRHGAFSNHSAVHDGIQTLPMYLKKLGYRVVIAGKTDFGERRNFPFEYLSTSVVGKGLNGKLQTGEVDKLLASRDRKQPIAIIVASFASHVPWPDNQGYDAKKLTIPPYLYDTPELRDARTRYLTKVTLADTELGEVRKSMAKYGDPKNTLFLFTADQGAQFPFAKWNLYDAGIATPLLAVWPGHIQAGKSSDALVSLVDLLPTFEEVAGGPAPQGVDGKSLVPLLTGKASSIRDEVYAAHTGDGTNIAPMRTIRTSKYKLIVNYHPEIEVRNAITENTQKRDNTYWLSWLEAAKSDPKAKAVVDHFQHRPAVEFFDIQKDPYELHNLAGQPGTAAIEKDLRGKLEKWMVSQGEDLNHIVMPADATKGHFPYGQVSDEAEAQRKGNGKRRPGAKQEDSE